MEEKILEMGEELSELRDTEYTMRTQLQVENTWLRRKLQEKENQLATMESLSMEALQYGLPSKSYALYLKDQWMQLQINTLAQHGTMPLQDYRKFIDLCDKSTLEDKAKLYKFYLHNLALTDLNVWDHNAKLGDL